MFNLEYLTDEEKALVVKMFEPGAEILQDRPTAQDREKQITDALKARQDTKRNALNGIIDSYLKT